MLPYLEIAGLKIPMYSLMIVIGVVFGGLYFFLVTFKEEKFSKLTLKRFLIVIILSAICLIVGAALFDSLFHSIEEGELVMGGITWLGGVVVAFPTFVLLSELLIPDAKGRAMKFFSLIVPSIVLAHAFGRIGCFCGGCCYGKVTDSIFGVQFPFLEEKVLPTQLFESVFDLILFTVMAVFRKKFKYHNFEIYFMAYGIFRFFNEFLRGDDRGATSSILSPAQLLSLAIVVAGIIIASRYLINKKINQQLSVSRRIDYALLFASKEDFKLKLSWRNGAIILTSLVLVLFIASCSCKSNECTRVYESCFHNFTCLGCACKCMAEDAEKARESMGQTDSQSASEVATGCCNLCQVSFCNDVCDCKGCQSACNDCKNGGCSGEDYISLIFISLRNKLSALLSFTNQMVYHN